MVGLLVNVYMTRMLIMNHRITVRNSVNCHYWVHYIIMPEEESLSLINPTIILFMQSISTKCFFLPFNISCAAIGAGGRGYTHTFTLTSYLFSTVGILLIIICQRSRVIPGPLTYNCRQGRRYEFWAPSMGNIVGTLSLSCRVEGGGCHGDGDCTTEPTISDRRGCLCCGNIVFYHMG